MRRCAVSSTASSSACRRLEPARRRTAWRPARSTSGWTKAARSPPAPATRRCSPLANAISDGAGDDTGDGNRIADADAAPDDASPAQAAGDNGGGGIGQVADCLRFGRAGWRDAGRAVTLNACVHAVFDGRCVGPGEAVFGRWGEETLRLIPGRVGISSDNRDFRPLMPQDAQDCSIPTG